LKIYDLKLKNNIILGSSKYPSPSIFLKCVKNIRADMITVALRKIGDNPRKFYKTLEKTGCKILPNTAGCFNEKDAINTALMCRDIFETNFIKLEVIANKKNLAPSAKGTIKASEKLLKLGFKVLPYTNDDISFCRELIKIGCKVIMPWGSPIGTGQGLVNIKKLKKIRDSFKDITLILDAGIGRVSHACQVIELGYDGILLNSAVALAKKPENFAQSVYDAVRAAEKSLKAGPISISSKAIPSTTFKGMAFQK
tara:strand:+ start:1229 stop:1990 length:762 start_codon:yes stop_codon:yes gene_type:complete